MRDDGCIDKEERFVHVEKTRAQRTQERNKKDGERVKRAYNHLSSWLREMADRPRKTGSRYGSRKGGGSLGRAGNADAGRAAGSRRWVRKVDHGRCSQRRDERAAWAFALPLPGQRRTGPGGCRASLATQWRRPTSALSVSSTKAQAKADLLHHREGRHRGFDGPSQRRRRRKPRLTWPSTRRPPD